MQLVSKMQFLIKIQRRRFSFCIQSDFDKRLNPTPENPADTYDTEAGNF